MLREQRTLSRNVDFQIATHVQFPSCLPVCINQQHTSHCSQSSALRVIMLIAHLSVTEPALKRPLVGVQFANFQHATPVRRALFSPRAPLIESGDAGHCPRLGVRIDDQLGANTHNADSETVSAITGQVRTRCLQLITWISHDESPK